jgi:hypothetical protein
MIKRDKNQIVGLKLRIRESLRAKIEKAASASGISMNSEMERRLEQTFSLEQRLEQHEDRLEQEIARLHVEIAEIAKSIRRGK